MGDNSNPEKNNSNPEKTQHHLIFTYGTLKTNLPNHNIIQTLISSNHATFIGPCTTIKPYPLIIGPYNIPYLINLPGSGHPIKGELYSVSNYGLVILDELEGVSLGHYERLSVGIDGGNGKVEAYFAGSGFGEMMWEKKGRVGIEEYTEVEAGEYVTRDFRPEGIDFLGAIRLFLE